MVLELRNLSINATLQDTDLILTWNPNQIQHSDLDGGKYGVVHADGRPRARADHAHYELRLYYYKPHGRFHGGANSLNHDSSTQFTIQVTPNEYSGGYRIDNQYRGISTYDREFAPLMSRWVLYSKIVLTEDQLQSGRYVIHNFWDYSAKIIKRNPKTYRTKSSPHVKWIFCLRANEYNATEQKTARQIFSFSNLSNIIRIDF